MGPIWRGRRLGWKVFLGVEPENSGCAGSVVGLVRIVGARGWCGRGWCGLVGVWTLDNQRS